MKSFNLMITQCLILLFDMVWGSGILVKPTGRPSRWRVDKRAPINLNDHLNNCGGFIVQWHRNEGRCGICGDNFEDPIPRANEMGGKYGGSGTIMETYENSFSAHIIFLIKNNHGGYAYFEICNLDVHPQETEECFRKNHIKVADGGLRYNIGNRTGVIETTILLPTGLSCQHCVLRWTYRGGDNLGICKDGSTAIGCGPQETTKVCADISIKAPKFI